MSLGCLTQNQQLTPPSNGHQEQKDKYRPAPTATHFSTTSRMKPAPTAANPIIARHFPPHPTKDIYLAHSQFHVEQFGFDVRVGAGNRRVKWGWPGEVRGWAVGVEGVTGQDAVFGAGEFVASCGFLCG